MPGPLGIDSHCPPIDAGTNALCTHLPSGAAQGNPTPSPPTSDISAADGMKIQMEAATWKGTPYALVGAASVKGADGGGDCSGSNAAIYKAAGFAYEYNATATFRAYAMRSGRFRELDLTKEIMQPGDLLSWTSHMALHAEFGPNDPDRSTDRINNRGTHYDQINDMWTATHTGGPAYQAHRQSWFRSDPPKVYRYQRLPQPAH